MRRTGRKTAKKSYSSSGTLKRRNIITNLEASHGYLQTQLLKEKQAALAQERLLKNLIGNPNLGKRTSTAGSIWETGHLSSYVEPKIQDGKLVNATDYLNTLRNNVRIDRDFTVKNKRFRVMGAPFDLTPRMGIIWADACIDRGKATNDVVKKLVNAYHGIAGFYLSLLNTSFDLLDLLKIVQTSIQEGNTFRAKMLLDEAGNYVVDYTNKMTSREDESETERLVKRFALLSPTIDNLEWGDGGHPELLETMYGRVWATIQDQSQIVLSNNSNRPQSQREIKVSRPISRVASSRIINSGAQLVEGLARVEIGQPRVDLELEMEEY